MPATYSSLLFLYPKGHREVFGEEMLAVFAEAERDIAGAGGLARAVFYTREFSGLVKGALVERVCSVTGFRSWNVLPYRRYAMRSEFRFSKATPILMMLILVGIAIVIEKATAIRNSVYPAVSQHVGPIQPEHFTFLPSLMLMFGVAYLAGMIGWAVLYALHRSGMHRLDAMNGRE